MDEKLNYIYHMYPDAKCELKYNNIFQLLIAVTLSAQTTDLRVNMCTPILFNKYPNVIDLANANLIDVINIIKPIGMCQTKGKHIIEIAKIIHEKYHDEVPNNPDELSILPGVGRKTINVVLAAGFHIPALPVDTHINRIAKRLKIAKIDDDVIKVEEKLKKKIEKEHWIQLHHSLIFFGRYFCKAQKPRCQECKLFGQCRINYK